MTEDDEERTAAPTDDEPRRRRFQSRRDCEHCNHPRGKHHMGQECNQRKVDRNGQRFICNCTEWRKEKKARFA